MRTLFTTTVSHVDRKERDEQLYALCDALTAEFPAYRVAEWFKGDMAVAVFVSRAAGADPMDLPPIPAHLNGWGHGDLTLKLVA